MKRSIYTRLCQYAYRLNNNHSLSKDMVHDAWLNYHRYCGGNLFDQDILYGLRGVKMVWYHNLQHQSFRYKGQNYWKKVDSIDEFNEPLSTDNPFSYVDHQDKIGIVKKALNKYRAKNNEISRSLLKSYLKMVEKGYTSSEIAKEWGSSPQQIDSYKRKLKKIIHGQI